MINMSATDKIKLSNTIVTVGKFDGLHKGHEKLLSELTKKANGRRKVVLTFAAEPKDVLNNQTVKTIVTDEEKRLLCEKQGIDVYCSMPMTKEFLALEPDEFINEFLKKKLGATAIVCGPDFSFGNKGAGNVDYLKKNTEKYGYELYVIEKEKYHDKDISSTGIRSSIIEGRIEETNEMLDHPYSVIGKVEEGKKIGRTINFLTANILPAATKLLPPNGVYATRTNINGKSYRSITNVGINPTISENNPTKVETYVANFHGNLYGEVIEVSFYEFMRGERKFDDIEQLKKQITMDINDRIKMKI